ncbi:MAG TPA: hypothetical protein PKI59_00110 [Candidatus Cloacimonadota bacterium]|nr:hypothetical protein [Candidatus Cloacimonadota bacterium]
MNIVSRTTPLVIFFDDERTPDAAFFQAAIEQDYARFCKAQEIARSLAKALEQKPDVSADNILAAVCPTSVIISNNQNDLQSEANSNLAGETYWTFRLRDGEAIPLCARPYPRDLMYINLESGYPVRDVLK